MTKEQKEQRQQLEDNFEQLKLMWQSPDFNTKKIAKLFNTSPQVIARFMKLKGAGRKVTAHHTKVKYPSFYENLAEIKDMLASAKFSYNDIANKYNIPRHIIERYSKKLNLKVTKPIKEQPDFNLFRKNAQKIHNSKYQYLEETFQGSEYKVGVVCPDHGVFYTKANNHTNGSGCPRCSNSVSKIEIEISEYIKEKLNAL